MRTIVTMWLLTAMATAAMAFELGRGVVIRQPGTGAPNGVYFCTLKDHDGEHDRASGLDELMLHPVDAWMGWAQALSPTRGTFTDIQPLIDEAHQAAMQTFDRKVLPRSRDKHR
jgi:hypothetical protein